MFSYISAQMPRHSPQPVEQSNHALRQEQRILSHPILQLHRTTFSSAFGATSMSLCAGSRLTSTAFQPRFCGCSLDSLPLPYLNLKVNTEAMVLTSEEVFQAAQNNNGMSIFSGDVICVLPTDDVIVGCTPLPRYSMHQRLAILYTLPLSSWPNNISKYQSPDSICKCRFVGWPRKISRFEYLHCCQC